jgi:cytoskeleton protein RodZ
LLIVAAAAAVYLLPSGWLKWPQILPQATSTVTSPTPDAPDVPQAAAPTLTQSVPPAGADVPAVSVSGALQVRASAESWVEVLDANGQSLFARLVQPGETIGVDGEPPLKVRIGNAAVTQVIFRGQTMELAPFTRENVARLELK